MSHGLVLFAACIFAILLLTSRRIGAFGVTLPMICLALGFGLSFMSPALMGDLDHSLTILAEATLALVLFSDAASLRRIDLRAESSWPVRMLLLGMPLTILFGFGAILVLIPDLGLWSAFLFAALLVPTDAALGQSLVMDPKIPKKTRHAILVESGLNDGLALPIILFAACGAAGFAHDLGIDSWPLFAAKQIGLGLIVGAGLGAIGGWALSFARQSDWVQHGHGGIFAVLLVVIIYFATDALGGNSFVATFAAGFAFAKMAQDCGTQAREFLESDGSLLIMLSFFFIGAVILPTGLAALTVPISIFIIASLFVIRPLAIALSLIGSSADVRTKLTLGWFGPRGLATALFVIVVFDDVMDIPAETILLAGTSLAVVLSTILHGVSAHILPRFFNGEDQ